MHSYVCTHLAFKLLELQSWVWPHDRIRTRAQLTNIKTKQAGDQMSFNLQPLEQRGPVISRYPNIQHHVPGTDRLQ